MTATSMIPARCIPVLDYITAHPGCTRAEIATALGMAMHNLADRLTSLDAAKVIERKHMQGTGRLAFFFAAGSSAPAATPDEQRPGIMQVSRRVTVQGKRDGEDVTISLPAAPFEIPVADRSETAPCGPLIRVDGRDGAWLTKRAIGRWGGHGHR